MKSKGSAAFNYLIGTFCNTPYYVYKKTLVTPPTQQRLDEPNSVEIKGTKETIKETFEPLNEQIAVFAYAIVNEIKKKNIVEIISLDSFKSLNGLLMEKFVD